MSADPITSCQERVAALADAALARARTEDDVADLLAAVWAIVDEAHDDALPAGAPPPACGPGCAACCVLHVGTLALEGIVAARHLRRTRPAGELPVVLERLRAVHDRVRWLEDRERIAGRVACALLDAEGSCTIHAARPLACRSVTSLDPDECRSALTARAEGDEDGGVVRMDFLQRALHDAARAALVEALAARGLDARCRDVSGMTAAFLADPRAAAAFLAGARTAVD